MDVFAINFTHNEVAFLRHALEFVTISGKDAKFLAHLQNKLELEISEIEKIQAGEETRKQKELQELIKAENLKEQSKKS